MNIAAVQLCSTSNLDSNLQRIEDLLSKEKNKHIDLCVLPENFALMPKFPNQKLDSQESFGFGKVQDWLGMLSRKYNFWVIAGSFSISSKNLDKPYARCLVYNPEGQCVAHYDKIHLFDVSVTNDESYCESKDTLAGHNPVVVEINEFKIGLSICYDLRFPELYRYYQEAKVDLIVAPSAFTYETGEKHWETLIKCRAVENLAYLVAPNQTGTHDNGRTTYGHSLIVDPWAKTLASLGEHEGVLLAEISKEKLKKIRNSFPALSHRKLF